MSRIGIILDTLYHVIRDRGDRPMMGSYTNYLLEGGTDKILAKLSEETTELTLAVKNSHNPVEDKIGDNRDGSVIKEAADVFYHLLVLLHQEGVALDEIAAELEMRRYREEEKVEIEL